VFAAVRFDAGCLSFVVESKHIHIYICLYAHHCLSLLTGKTIQCVALIAHLLTMGVSGPFVIVAPLATLPNWVREFEKWLPGHPVIRYYGTAQEREAMLKGPLHPKGRRNPDFPFIVTSYEVAIRDQSKLEKLCELSYLIVDEGHRLKNHRCCLLTSLKRLKAANRLLLTGTPIQNTLSVSASNRC
jgi:ATP-dependent DNA helicase